MTVLKQLAVVFFGLASGAAIAGAVIAFLTKVGLVTRLAQKTGTKKQIKLYEESLMFGAIFGASTMFIPYNLPLGYVFAVVLCFCIGVFFGCLAMSLAEVINVIPIMTRRVRIQSGMFYFVLAIAFGKMAGSLIYFLVPGFYHF